MHANVHMYWILRPEKTNGMRLKFGVCVTDVCVLFFFFKENEVHGILSFQTDGFIII